MYRNFDRQNNTCSSQLIANLIKITTEKELQHLGCYLKHSSVIALRTPFCFTFSYSSFPKARLNCLQIENTKKVSLKSKFFSSLYKSPLQPDCARNIHLSCCLKCYKIEIKELKKSRITYSCMKLEHVDMIWLGDSSITISSPDSSSASCSSRAYLAISSRSWNRKDREIKTVQINFPCLNELITFSTLRYL